MDNGSREAKRIQKEQENAQIDKLIAEIKPIITKIPKSFMCWDLIKTQQFKEFHALAIKKINMQRIKVADIVSIRQKVMQWYGE